MLLGRVARPPSYQATLLSLDGPRARRMPGVVAVVRDGRFLGVVAEREEQAVKARRPWQAARWEMPARRPTRRGCMRTAGAEDRRHGPSGEAAAMRRPVAQRLSATYTKRYIAHASIGPSARWRDRPMAVGAGLVA